ncbi:Cytochrome c [Albimonas donghaensis]|uniref:Cytochrome c n=1 Tax=Albimonas donghaensis TaxID=356660 RepID=A0A1H2S9I5_9RHOB|nr:Cytochrome c [Albimonas donghaensis]
MPDPTPPAAAASARGAAGRPACGSPAPRLALAALIALGALAAPGSRAQEASEAGTGTGPAPAAELAVEPAAEPLRDLRPPAVAYAVTDGIAIEAPLAGAVGDAARGRAIFLSDLTGGCVSCHAAPGAPRLAVVPRILRDRLPPMPAAILAEDADAEAEPEAGEGEPVDGDGSGDDAEESRSTSTSRLAPDRLAPPPARPAQGTVSETAAIDSGAADSEDIAARGRIRRGVPPLLPVPAGPDLDGIAAELSLGELRLAVVNPQISRPGSRMPAYHHVSLALADRAPGLRQPWLSAQEVEDVVAYLATLTEPAEAAPPAPEGAESAPAVPDAAETAAEAATEPEQSPDEAPGQAPGDTSRTAPPAAPGPDTTN